MANKNTVQKNQDRLAHARANAISPTRAIMSGFNSSETEEGNTEEQASNIKKQEDNKGQTVAPVRSTSTENPTVQTSEQVAVTAESQSYGRFGSLKSRFNKQRVEDTHTRRTFLVRNDLLERLDAISEKKHGFKIEFINLAIEAALQELEKEE
ncbi:hypothetical protein PP175_27165 (plasmid) [Aneurinibacillus sp. Ricciae_BoGa-3]|uniref:hypothetical protein n=1 Tax=Aneurinibacillus sp. Ricciae_BoGa-3 TaxID=3022697 RepID=UPI0023420EB0|nr:hypothetical protein [Aneurinibacillus sp. Ricciae_BoGa-3]WCK57719.1 hypothetical protein PP175_27165 [Aneurinibacillus sp. Ricciae_BoGa-3]